MGVVKGGDKYYAKEVKALEIFNREHLKHTSLIVFGQKSDDNFLTPNDYLTEREEKIVLSVIQWMGTPVGEGFINQLLEK